MKKRVPRNAEQSRAAILKAALDTFSREGVAGARTEEIARAAGVNKALLYYYFRDKAALHGAVLEYAISQSAPVIMEAIDAAETPREKLLAYVNAHFDAIAARPKLSRLMQHELVRASEGGGEHLRGMVERYNGPLFRKLGKVIERGVESGEFRKADPRQAVLSVVATVIFYFMIAPMLEILGDGADPLRPQCLEARKAAVLDFVSHALFAAPPERAKKKKKKKKKGKGSERKK